MNAQGCSLGELLAGWVDPAPADLLIRGLALDSRQVQPGDLFLAYPGTAQHGLAYAQAAREQGAAAILAQPDARWPLASLASLSAQLGIPVIPFSQLRAQIGPLADRFFGQPSARLSVMGVTGTNGKTSVTHYLAQALNAPCGIIGTLGTGFPDQLQPGTHTTPDPVQLHRSLAQLAAAGAEAVALEVSSHALDQDRVAGVRFSHAIFTNLSRDHLDYHGDMSVYAQAKRKLFRRSELAWAFLNFDDPIAQEILDDLQPTVRLGGYSLEPERRFPSRCQLWVRGRALAMQPQGLRMAVESNLGTGVLESPLFGRFNGANLLAVLLMLLAGGQSLSDALAQLRRVRGAPGRMERFQAPGRPQVVVDYAHTPDALEQVLCNLRPQVRGRLFVVFGCGGDRDVGKRPIMGAVAERLSDQVILTDDNPRSEEGDRIIRQIQAGMCAPERAWVERRRDRAIAQAIAQAAPEDLVLIAGKGHERFQELATGRVPFSDREQVQRALAARPQEKRA